MVSMSDFTFEFDMATTSTPRTASPSYTALKAFVMAGEGMAMQRGRGSEQESTAQPGRANVTLRNTDGRFTMGNGSSPYAPLQLRRPCRFRVTYSATTYGRWYGFVDEWGNDRVETTGVARLSMSDRLARAGKVILSEPVVSEMLADGPAALWKLDEPAGATVFTDSVNAANQMIVQTFGTGRTVTPGAGLSPGTSSSTQVAFTPDGLGDYGYLGMSVLTAGRPTGSTRTVSFFINTSILPAVRSRPVIYDSLSVWVETSGLLSVDLGSSGAINSLATVVDGRDHHIAVVATASSGTDALSLYIDGVLQGTSVPATGAWSAGADFSFGYDAFSGRLSNIAVYDGALSGDRIAAHAEALTDGWVGETTLERFARHCAQAGMPAAAYGTTGTSTIAVGPQPPAGTTLLAALDAVATTEAGALFVDDAGVLRLASVSSRYNTAVGLTLDTSKAGQVLAGSLDFRTDTDDLVNEVNVTREGGSLTSRVVDPTSQAAYDAHDETATLPAANDVIALNWAQWRVASYKDPRPRCESVTVDVVAYANSGGSVANLLNADVGTKLRLSNLPTDVYATSTLDLFIEGVRDEVTKDTYRITFTTSPVALEDSLWTLGTSALGSTAVLGY